MDIIRFETLLVLAITIHLSTQQITSLPPGMTHNPYITQVSNASPTFLPFPSRVSEYPAVSSPKPVPKDAVASTTTTTTTTKTTTTTPSQNGVTNNPNNSSSNGVANSLSNSPSIGITTTVVPLTSKPPNVFNVLVIYTNVSKLFKNEMTENEATNLKSSIAKALDVNNESISNVQLTYAGEPIRVKRSLAAPSNNDVTLNFDASTDKYNSSKMIEDRLKSNPIDFFGPQVQMSNVHVTKDSDNCPDAPCSNGTRCTLSQSTNITNPTIFYNGYQRVCIPMTSSASTNQGGPNLLYLLLLLLLIPIAILIGVGIYSYRNRKNKKDHFVNFYNKESLQAPNHSTHPFDTMGSEKSNIVIMGDEGPPNYETNPRSTAGRTRTATVASTHAFDNNLFNDEDQVGEHRSNDPPHLEGDDSMTFSYMQMRNSKVKDDSMGLF